MRLYASCKAAINNFLPIPIFLKFADTENEYNSIVKSPELFYIISSISFNIPIDPIMISFYVATQKLDFKKISSENKGGKSFFKSSI